MDLTIRTVSRSQRVSKEKVEIIGIQFYMSLWTIEINSCESMVLSIYNIEYNRERPSCKSRSLNDALRIVVLLSYRWKIAYTGTKRPHCKSRLFLKLEEVASRFQFIILQWNPLFSQIRSRQSWREIFLF